jgi:hypothetical protein
LPVNFAETVSQNRPQIFAAVATLIFLAVLAVQLCRSKMAETRLQSALDEKDREMKALTLAADPERNQPYSSLYKDNAADNGASDGPEVNRDVILDDHSTGSLPGNTFL